MMATGTHGIWGATSPAGVKSGNVGTEPSSDCAAIQPYTTPSTRPVRVAATVMCVASSSTIRRTWRFDRPIERSSPSSLRRCTTPIVRRFTRPTAAITAETATSTIITAAKASIGAKNSGGTSPVDWLIINALADSRATANIVTRVTPITTPIAIRDERSGYRSAFSAARRAVALDPNIRPTRRSTGGMNSTDPSARPVNESTPPTNATTTPSGVMSPTRTPPTRSSAPAMSSTQAPMCRPGLPETSSRVRSTEPPSDCSGVTASTRREPAQAAAHVVRATPIAGSATKG